MGGQIRTVGGGAATPTANNFNQFLNGQVNPQQPIDNSQRVAQLQSMIGRPGFNSDAARQEITRLQQQQQAASNPDATSQFQQLIQQLGGGGVQDQSGSQGVLQQLLASMNPQQSNNRQAGTGQGVAGGSMPTNMAPNPTAAFNGGMPVLTGGNNEGEMTNGQGIGNQSPVDERINISNGQSGGAQGTFTPQTYTNPYSSPQYQNPTLTQLPTSFSGTGQADLSGIKQVGGTQLNTSTGVGQVPTSGLEDMFRRFMSGGGFQGGGASAERVAMAPAKEFDMNDPYFNAIKTSGQMASDRNAAELRARFGAAGAGAMGSGAKYAESNLRATEAPQLTIAMQQALQGLQGQDLAERSAGANVALGSAGQGLQASIANQGTGLQNSSNILQALLSGRGQDLNAASTARGQDIQQLGLGVQQNLGFRDQDINQRGQDINALLSNQGMGNSFTQANNVLNSNNMQTNNANSITGANNANQFNLTNANSAANYGLGTNQLNSTNQTNAFSQMLQALGMGQQQNQFSAGQQAQLLQMLFGSLNNANGLGTPQAQVVQQPNPWAQLGGQLIGAAGQYATNR